jgi:hypothetical protein
MKIVVFANRSDNHPWCFSNIRVASLRLNFIPYSVGSIALEVPFPKAGRGFGLGGYVSASGKVIFPGRSK